MTVPSTVSEIPYAGDGVTVAFPIPFPFDTSADIVVKSTDASGNVTDVTASFTITGGGGSTGTATAAVAPAADVTITIIDDPEQSQETDYIDNDPFPADAHERALDKLTRLIKRLSKRIDRSLRAADGDPITDLTLGSVDNRKGRFLFFNAVTGAIEYALSLGSTIISQSIIGGLLNPQTAAESAALVTPGDTSVPSHDKVGIVRAARYLMATGASGAINRQSLVDGLSVLDGTLNGGIVGIGSGRYAISATVTFPQNSVIEGQGTSATQIQFDPASEDILFDVNVGGSTSVVRSGVRNLGFYSTNSTTKTAINVVDGRQCKIENVAINQGNWPGSGSIGIRAWGRDFYNIRDCDIECARPIIISSNPNHATIDLDTSTMVSVQLYTPEATGANIEVESGVVISNWKLDTVNFAGGRYGFLREDTSSPIASYQLAFFNCRTEQGDVVSDGDFNPDGWSFRITSTVQRQQDLVWDLCHFDPYRNGIYLRNADKIILRACTFVQVEGTALDITFDTQTVLILDNTLIQAGVTVTLTNARLAWAGRWNPSETAIPKFAVYVYDDGYAADPVNLVSQKPQFFGDMRFFPWTQTLTDDQQINLPVRAVDGMDSALVFVGAYGATGPVQASAMVHFTPAGANIVSSSGSVDDANTDGNLCILDGGSGALSIINRLGTSVKLSSFTFFAN